MVKSKARIRTLICFLIDFVHYNEMLHCHRCVLRMKKVYIMGAIRIGSALILLHDSPEHIAMAKLSFPRLLLLFRHSAKS